MTRTRLSSKLQRLKRLIRLGMPCAVASRKIKRVFSDSRANLESLLKKAYASSKTSPNFHDKFLVRDRKSTRLNSSHLGISYAVFCLKIKKHKNVKLRIRDFIIEGASVWSARLRD